MYIHTYTQIRFRSSPASPSTMRCSALWPQRRAVAGRCRRPPGLRGGQDPVPARGVGEVPDALQRALGEATGVTGERKGMAGTIGNPSGKWWFYGI